MKEFDIIHNEFDLTEEIDFVRQEELNWSNMSQYSSGFTFIINNKTFDNAKQKTSTVFDVADYLIDKLGEVSTLKLQKLIYYCQVWHLVWEEKPLFNEKIEAWANGPVVRELFNYHRGSYMVDHMSVGNRNILTNHQKEIINSVLEFYGNKTAKWLVDLTHIEKPWKQAREGLSSMERGTREIKLDTILEYYSSL